MLDRQSTANSPHRLFAQPAAVAVSSTSFLDLPNDLILFCLPLDMQTASALAKTNKRMHCLFKANVFTNSARLLLHMARGDETQAEAMLQQSSLEQQKDILCKKARVTDRSGRTFFCTAFQLAIWGRDWSMWRMLLKYLPLDVACSQLQELKAKGTAHGRYFNFLPLLMAYRTLCEYERQLQKDAYAPNFSEHSYTNKVNMIKETRAMYRLKIEEQQRLLPVHILRTFTFRKETFTNTDDIAIEFDTVRKIINKAEKKYYLLEQQLTLSLETEVSANEERLAPPVVSLNGVP